jgi:hypothetical protein
LRIEDGPRHALDQLVGGVLVSEMNGLHLLVHQHGRVDVRSAWSVSYDDYSCHDQLLGFVGGKLA